MIPGTMVVSYGVPGERSVNFRLSFFDELPSCSWLAAHDIRSYNELVPSSPPRITSAVKICVVYRLIALT